MMRQTIYEDMRARLGREPTHHELCLEVRRIIEDANASVAVRSRPTRDEQRASYRAAMIDAGRGRLLG